MRQLFLFAWLCCFPLLGWAVSPHSKPINSNFRTHSNSLPKQSVISKPIHFPKANRSKEIIVVIDPGHGGKDPGAIGDHDLKEKDVVLAIAKKLQGVINKQPGFKAVMTRDGDYYLTLRERLNIARQNKADMFIAIHADAVDDPFAHGVSVYALSLRGATSEAARWAAARENQSALMGGVELADKGDVLRSVLINLSQSATIQASLTIGQNLLANIKPFANLHYQHMEQAAFVVLKSPDIPSLLVETGFLSNAVEEKKLNYAHYQLNLAQAMMRGIKKYFISRPPRGTSLASQENPPHYK
jgi:N-acetylmuramoyl-L-alanine amidase